MSCGCRNLLAGFASVSAPAQLPPLAAPPVNVNVPPFPLKAWRYPRSRYVPLVNETKLVVDVAPGRLGVEIFGDPTNAVRIMLLPVPVGGSDRPTATFGIPIQASGYYSPPGVVGVECQLWAFSTGTVGLTVVEWFE